MEPTTMNEYIKEKYKTDFFGLYSGDVPYIYFRYVEPPSHKEHLRGKNLALVVGHGHLEEVVRRSDGSVQHIEAALGLMLNDEVYVFEDNTFSYSQIKIGGE